MYASGHMNVPRELALRLLVAYASTVWGYAGMDCLLKKFRKEPLDPIWIKIAQAMLRDAKVRTKIQ